MKDKSNENLIEGFAIADRNMAIERGDYKAELMRRLATRDAERDTLKAEVARLTDPAMKCRECPFNLTADLATRDAVIRELVGALMFLCDSLDDKDGYHNRAGHPANNLHAYHAARATLTRARDTLKGQGEPKRDYPVVVIRKDAPKLAWPCNHGEDCKVCGYKKPKEDDDASD